MDNQTPDFAPQNQNSMNAQPVGGQAPAHSSSHVSLLGLVILVGVLGLGALYIINNVGQDDGFFESAPSPESIQDLESDIYGDQNVVDTNAFVETQATVTPGADLSDIATDIDGTNLNSVDIGIEGL